MTTADDAPKTMKDLLRIYGPAVLLVLTGFFIAFQFIKPAPPVKVVIASGGESGAYFAFARAYAERFEAEGMTLEVLNTGGSVENIQLLHEGKVDIAFIQSGIEDLEGQDRLESLGSLYYEPMWLFHRANLELDRLGEIKGLRVSVGGEGSGTTALVNTLLKDNGLTADALDTRALGGQAAADALLAGEIDAAFFVSSAKSQLIQTLLRDDSLELSSFQRAEAYSRRYRFLNSVMLPEGAVDLQQNIPDRDVSLLAPAANLVIRKDLHPAVVDLLMLVSRAEHAEGDWFEARNQFPQDDMLAYPLSADAERFYRNGPSFLQRYLPFWAASLIDRLKIMIVPLVLMMLPLIKVMPPIYNWRMRARVYRWYEELQQVDQRLFVVDSLDVTERKSLTAELNRIEADVREVRIPLSFSSQLYHLRQHIDLVRQRLAAVDGIKNVQPEMG